MNLLFIHDHKFRLIDGEFYSTGGLSNDVLTRYTNSFGKVTVVARVICTHEKNDSLSRIVNPNVKIVGAKDLNKFQIEELIKNSNGVIIRVPSILGTKLIRSVKKYKKPYLVEVVGCAWDSFWNHSFRGKLVAPIMWMGTKLVVRNAPYALYVTNQFLQKRYPSNGKILGCSDVSLPFISDEILLDRIIKISNINCNKSIVIGTVATLNVRYKGQQYIIRAIAKLRSKGYNFEYQLVGGGDNSYLQSVAKKYGVEKNIKFIGLLPHEKIFDWIDSIDIYAQPSKTEGMPRALIEAMSRGCPTIGSRVGGIPELIEDKFTFAIGDVKRICTLLIKMDKNNMNMQAQRNFQISKKYNKYILNQKRNILMNEFKEFGNKL